MKYSNLEYFGNCYYLQSLFSSHYYYFSFCEFFWGVSVCVKSSHAKEASQPAPKLKLVIIALLVLQMVV